MTLTSDIQLFHPLWEKADRELCSSDGIGLFGRLIDLYILACAIGIKEDRTIVDIEMPLEKEKSIGRNTYQSMLNTDLKASLDFMLQNALLNSKTIDFSVDERLKLAFDPDYTVKKLSAAAFLTGFANYGIEKIYEIIGSTAPIVVVDEIHSYFETLAESRYDDILKYITLDNIVDEE